MTLKDILTAESLGSDLSGSVVTASKQTGVCLIEAFCSRKWSLKSRGSLRTTMLPAAAAEEGRSLQASLTGKERVRDPQDRRAFSWPAQANCGLARCKTPK